MLTPSSRRQKRDNGESSRGWLTLKEDALVQNCINLSSHQLTDNEMAVLRKGLNFAPTPKVLPITEIISGVEPALRKCNEDQAYVVEKTRAIIADNLRIAKPIQLNIQDIAFIRW